MPVNGKFISISFRSLSIYFRGLLLFLVPTISLASELPKRIVSINVCADQLVATLVEQERIISLSYLSRDPNSSWLGSLTEKIHINHGTAEEIISLNPDLVVTGAFGFRPTVSILKRLGYRVLELPFAKTIDDISTNLNLLTNAVGNNKKTNALIDRFYEETKKVPISTTEVLPLFVNYETNGWISRDDSLPNHIAQRVGFNTIGRQYEVRTSHKIDLEALLILGPDLINIGYQWNESPALVSEYMQHPALEELLRRTKQINVPDPYWLCGSLKTQDAILILKQAREELFSNRKN